MRTPTTILKARHAAAADFGDTSVWPEYRLEHPRLGSVPGKVFLGQELGLTGMEVSFGSLPPGVGVPFLHAHKQNEELYLVLSGEGEMQIDGAIIPLRPGSAVRVDPPAMRTLRAGSRAPLCYLVVQAKAQSLEQATSRDGILSDQPVSW